MTYFFTPHYDAHSLVDEDNYLVLEHSCLRPSRAEMVLLNQGSCVFVCLLCVFVCMCLCLLTEFVSFISKDLCPVMFVKCFVGLSI